MARGRSATLPLFLPGLLLLLLGLFWASVDSTGYLPRFVAVAGGLLLALAAIRNAREIRFLLVQVREHAEPGPATTLLLLALVLALGAVAAERLLAPVDLTAERFNSLARGSRQVLAALERPVRLEAFYADPSPQWDLARRMLALYERESRRLQADLIDPDREPARAREAGIERSGVLVVTSGEARAEVTQLTEEAITQGILRVLAGRPRRVAVLQGHGEPSFVAGGEAGITAWMQALREANVLAAPLTLLQTGEMPTDYDALLIVHPTTPLYPSETTAVRRYVEGGGRLGLWVEPGDSTGLEPWLDVYYLQLLPGFIHDRGRATAGVGVGPWAPALVGDPQHPITAGLRSFVVASGARGLAVESPHPIDLVIEPFLKTAGRVEVYPTPERAGDPVRRQIENVGVVLEWPVPVGEAWDRERAAGGEDLPPLKPKARIAVLGDAALVTNRFLGTGANRDLALAVVHWLTEQERYLGLARERARPARLRVDLRGLRVLLYVVEFGLPALLAALGLLVWLRRRGTGG